MSVSKDLLTNFKAVIAELFQKKVQKKHVAISPTKIGFGSDYTITLFVISEKLKDSPGNIGEKIGAKLVSNYPQIYKSFNIERGFLNLVISDEYWISFIEKKYLKPKLVNRGKKKKKIILEYSSPNTNKPLHLGHLRNNFLGWSMAEIFKTSGFEVFKTQVFNDRGIHICKSMAGWKHFANGATPESTGTKPDHFVGDYYVKAENTIKEQAKAVLSRISVKDFTDFDPGPERDNILKLLNEYEELNNRFEKTKETKKVFDKIIELAKKNTFFMKVVQDMLLAWEKNDPEVRELWKRMNDWVYEGYNETYKKIGSNFDKNYFESELYLLGKEFVKEGLQKNIFFVKKDGSVWIDLTSDGLDEKLVLRSDGTSVYITQDLGLADRKYEDFYYDQSFYVIADEQNYHMKVLKLILKKLEKPYASGIHHLSYGLVELPSGRMKTREGTVVDADDIIKELKKVAIAKTEELGKVKDFNPGELSELYETIALGALKFFLLRVDPKKKMIFNPEESIDFHGYTGPFIQYTHARIKSILRKAKDTELLIRKNKSTTSKQPLMKLERELIILLEQYGLTLDQVLHEHNPSLLANYTYNVAKIFNTFYANHSVMNAESEEKKQLRLQICFLTANTLATGMKLLGIRVPERM